MMKAYVNQTNTYEGSTVVVEHQDKDQAAGLNLAESFILCGHQAFRTHIKNIAVDSSTKRHVTKRPVTKRPVTKRPSHNIRRVRTSGVKTSVATKRPW
jgi:hypothetical protein